MTEKEKKQLKEQLLREIVQEIIGQEKRSVQSIQEHTLYK